MKQLNLFVALCLAFCLQAQSVEGQIRLPGKSDSSSESSSSSSKSAGSVVSNIVSALGGSTASNVVTSVLGLQNLTAEELVGTWKYSGAGCAFTSEKTLAAAGGEVVASEVTEKIEPYYEKLGITSSNTYFTFDDDNKYSAKIAGKSVSGSYTFDEDENSLSLKVLLVNITAYTKRSGTGISILFEADKLLTLLQTVASLSGNDTLETIGDLSENYDGVRIGFDLDE